MTPVEHLGHVLLLGVADEPLKMYGIRDAIYDKLVAGRGGLYLNLPEIEDIADDAGEDGLHILDVVQVEKGRNIAMEEATLVDIDDAVRGQYPHIVVVVSPSEEDEVPYYEGPQRRKEQHKTSAGVDCTPLGQGSEYQRHEEEGNQEDDGKAEYVFE